MKKKMKKEKQKEKKMMKKKKKTKKREEKETLASKQYSTEYKDVSTVNFYTPPPPIISDFLLCSVLSSCHYLIFSLNFQQQGPQENKPRGSISEFRINQMLYIGINGGNL